MRRNGFKIREREDRGKEEDKERGGFGRRNGDKEGGGRVDEEVRKEQHRQNAGDLQQS